MFQGSMVALVTPMSDDGAVDFEALDQLVGFHLDRGTDAIVAVGTTGESATLNHDEHCKVVSRVARAVDGAIPVIAGTGSNSTSEAIALTKCAQQAGADGALLVTPYYNKPTQHGLVAHFRAIAVAVALPQILYNVPGRTACDLLPETVAELSAVPNIVGIKEASGDVGRVARIRELCDHPMDIYSGDDGNALASIMAGGKGVISVTANIAPKQVHDVCAMALAGDHEGAKALDATLQPLHEALFVESNPIPVKWGVSALGLCGLGIRLPLTPLSEHLRADLRAKMVDAGLLPA
ncbi:MAG: 4-hydroxy-tetrahydrodipicolinate synthase [Gammaproteobacteria bacterium]